MILIKCNFCKKEKSINNFYKDKQKKTGYRPRCKVCDKLSIDVKRKAIREKKYRNNHREERNLCRRFYEKNRRKTDIKFRTNCSMRSAIWKSLGGIKNHKRWTDLVGYSFNDFKNHFESLFTNGMSWKKFLNGEIHIDHKIPLSVHNFTDPSHTDFKRAWALKNLQPMWAMDNIKKGAKLEKHFQPSLPL